MGRLINKKGFTLVELLVVVTIIAILSTIGIVIFTDAQKNARDARRKSDVDAITKAIETTKGVATVGYKSLPAGGFSGGAVPVDNNDATGKPHYCINTSTANSVGDGTPWIDTSECPTAISDLFDSGWVSIGSWGLGVGGAATTTANVPGTSKGTTATDSKFGTGVISWKVCTRLESNGVIYCKGSGQ